MNRREKNGTKEITERLGEIVSSEPEEKEVSDRNEEFSPEPILDAGKTTATDAGRRRTRAVTTGNTPLPQREDDDYPGEYNAFDLVTNSQLYDEETIRYGNMAQNNKKRTGRKRQRHSSSLFTGDINGTGTRPPVDTNIAPPLRSPLSFAQPGTHPGARGGNKRNRQCGPAPGGASYTGKKARIGISESESDTGKSTDASDDEEGGDNFPDRPRPGPFPAELTPTTGDVRKIVQRFEMLREYEKHERRKRAESPFVKYATSVASHTGKDRDSFLQKPLVSLDSTRWRFLKDKELLVTKLQKILRDYSDVSPEPSTGPEIGHSSGSSSSGLKSKVKNEPVGSGFLPDLEGFRSVDPDEILIRQHLGQILNLKREVEKEYIRALQENEVWFENYHPGKKIKSEYTHTDYIDELENEIRSLTEGFLNTTAYNFGRADSHRTGSSQYEIGEVLALNIIVAYPVGRTLLAKVIGSQKVNAKANSAAASQSRHKRNSILTIANMAIREFERWLSENQEVFDDRLPGSEPVPTGAILFTGDDMVDVDDFDEV